MGLALLQSFNQSKTTTKEPQTNQCVLEDLVLLAEPGSVLCVPIWLLASPA